MRLIPPPWETWSQLRAFGNSRLVQATVVVPRIGYLILFSEDLNGYFTLIFDGPASEGPDRAPLRLYLIYFGFCSLAVGSTMFALMCPEVVKSHGADYEYVAKERRLLDRAEIGMINDRLGAEFGESYYSSSVGAGLTERVDDE